MPSKVGIVLISGIVASVCAFGQSLQFTIEPAAGGGAGTYSYGGSGGALTGSDITISSLAVTGASNNGSYTVTDGALNFTSGSLSSSSGTSWDFGSGGSLYITGCIAGVSTSANCSNNVLLGDDFSSIELAELGPPFGDLTLGALTGTYNSQIANYFGVSAAFNAASGQEIDSVTVATSGSGFTATNSGGGSIGTTATAEVATPEDWSLSSSLGIFAFGFAVFAVARRFGLIKAVAF